MEKSPLKIITYPHPTLRHKSKSLRRVDVDLVDVIKEMFGLMYAANGIGLAANQVDLPLRFFIVNLAAKPGEGEELVFINPVISHPKGNDEAEEGCLSLPEVYGQVKRSKQVTINAFDLQGREIQAEIGGMLARVVQHELDHLDGVLFIDRMTTTGKTTLSEALEVFELDFQSQRETGGIPKDDAITTRLQQWEQKYC